MIQIYYDSNVKIKNQILANFMAGTEIERNKNP